MNNRVTQTALVFAATLLITVVPCTAGQPEKPTDDGETEQKTSTAIVVDEPAKVAVDAAISDHFFDTYIKDHLQIGLRSAARVLTDDDSGHRGGSYGSGTYLGTIYALDEEQNGAPILLNITYFFNNYIGVEFAYDRIDVETVAFSSSTLQDKTDGNVIIAGPTLSLIAQYRNSTDFIPYAGAGLGFYSGTFDADPEWTLASKYNGAAYNHMEIDDVVGLQLTAGTKWLFTKNWALDLSVQYIRADTDATYTGYYNDEKYTIQTGHFPMDNVAFRLGIAYHF